MQINFNLAPILAANCGDVLIEQEAYGSRNQNYDMESLRSPV